MNPLKFKEANTELQPPPGMDDCDALPVFRYTDPKTRCTVWLSCWRVTWWERVEILLTGRTWLWVHQFTHPPVAVTGESPFRKGKIKHALNLAGWMDWLGAKRVECRASSVEGNTGNGKGPQ